MTFAIVIIAFIVYIAVLTILGGRRRRNLGRSSPSDSGDSGSFFLFTDSGSIHHGDSGSCHGGDGGSCGGH